MTSAMTMPPSDLPARPLPHGQPVPSARPVAGRRDAARHPGTRAAAELAEQRSRPPAQQAPERHAAPRSDEKLRGASDSAPFRVTAAPPHAGGNAATLFLAHVLAQDQAAQMAPAVTRLGAAAEGSDAYRRAGASPPIFSEEPAIFSRVV